MSQTASLLSLSFPFLPRERKRGKIGSSATLHLLDRNSSVYRTHNARALQEERAQHYNLTKTGSPDLLLLKWANTSPSRQIETKPCKVKWNKRPTRIVTSTVVTHPLRCKGKSRSLPTWAWWAAIPIPAARRRRADSRWWKSRPSTSAWRTPWSRWEPCLMAYKLGREGPSRECIERDHQRGEKESGAERERASPTDARDEGSLITYLWGERHKRRVGGVIVSLSLQLQMDTRVQLLQEYKIKALNFEPNRR